MFYKSCMKKGISLEVIVEEDDNSEVTYYAHKTKANGKTKKEKKEKETWIPERIRRSVSCEALTVLDVGEDKTSQDDWEEEVKSWNCEDQITIPKMISRTKILQSKEKIDEESYSQIEPNHNHFGECSQFIAKTEHGVNTEKEKSYIMSVENEQSTNSNEKEIHIAKIEKVDNKSEDVNSKKGQNEKENSHVSMKKEYNYKEDYIYEEIEAFDEKKPDYTCSQQTQTSKNKEEKNDNRQTSSFPENDSMYLESESSSLENSISFSIEDMEKEDIEQDVLADRKNEIVRKYDEVNTDYTRPDLWSNEESEDAWITVGELENIEYENTYEEPQLLNDSPTELNTLSTQSKQNTQPLTPQENSQIPINSDVMKKQPKHLESKPCTYIPTAEYIENELNKDVEPVVNIQCKKEIFDSLERPAGTKQISIGSHRNTSDVLENKAITSIQKIRQSHEIYESFESESKNQNWSNCHNRELIPEELPKPHTVASVRQLFEYSPNSEALYEISEFEYVDHVRSNPSSKIFRMDSMSQRTKNKPCPRRKLSRTPTIYLRVSDSSNKVALRKPTVAKGFNIRKALLDNPRYFHIKMENKISKPMPNQKYDTREKWLKSRELDGCEVESCTSESSEDSGVSKDFSSSTLSLCDTSIKKKSKISPILEESTDPNFKWIDPDVLARIRAVGTTVIFFGPKSRCQQMKEVRHGMSEEKARIRNMLFEKLNFKNPLLTREESPRVIGALPKSHSRSVPAV